MQKHLTQHASWRELLEAPATPSHIVQIYDCDDFLASGAGFFAAEGLRRGEAVFLVGTRTHLADIDQHLVALGIDTVSAMRSGQLTATDVGEALDRLLVNGMPDEARYREEMLGALEQASKDARFTGVRAWGEMSNHIYQHCGEKAALASERLSHAVAGQLGMRVLCSFHCDRFDPVGYEGILRDMCCEHSHVIPADDYVRHRLAVNRAIAEVVGEIRGPLLQSLLSWKGLSCELPSSQALLFWLRETMPERLAEVLSRARAYQLEQAVTA